MSRTRTTALTLALAACLARGAMAQAVPVGPAAFLSGDTVAAGSFGNEQSPSLAAGAGGYLVAWTDDRTKTLGTSTWQQSEDDVWAQRLDATGTPVGGPFPVADSWGYQRNPRVAFNGENFLVAWIDQAPTQFFYENAIKAVRVSPAGVVLDAQPITVFQPGDGFALTTIGDTWVFVAQNTGSTTNEGLVARRVSAAGALLDASAVVLVPPTHFLYFSVDARGAGNELLLTWEGQGSQLARRFDGNLAPVGAAFTLPGRVLGGNGSAWFVLWSAGGSLRGTPIAPDGSLLVPAGALIASGAAANAFELRVGWDGTNWIAAWLHPVDAVRLARVATSGTVLDPNGAVLDASDDDVIAGITLAGATSGDGLVLAWTDSRAGGSHPYDVRGRHVAPNLVPGPSSVLSTAAPAQMRVELAEYPGGFLAVYESRAAGTTRIVVQRVSASGVALDAEPLALASGSVGAPAAVWNGRVFMVAWADVDGIRARQLAADGTPLGTASTLLMPGGFGPDVAALGETFLLTGLKFGFSVQFIHPYAMRVDGLTGAALDAPVALGNSYASGVRAVAVGDRFVVTWQRNYTHDDPQSQVERCFVETSGAITPFAVVAFNSGHPDVAWSGGEALFVFRVNSLSNANNDVALRRMLPDGSFPAGQAVLSAGPGRQLYPVVAWDGARFVAAWEDQRHQAAFYDGRTDIYGARIAASGVLLDPAGFAIEIGQQPAARPALAAVAGTPGSALAASSVMRGDDPQTSHYRIGARLVGATPLWSDVGAALAAGGAAPFLQGGGALAGGTPVTLALQGAAPGGPLVLVVGLSAPGAPFKGGVMVPQPDLLLAGLVADGVGALQLAGTWPDGLPTGASLWMQAWLANAAGPFGFAASNAVQATTP